MTDEAYRSVQVHPSKHFQGRDAHLRRMSEAYSSSAEHPALVSLHGLPGIGKTQLAAQYCRSQAHNYHVILWNEADTLTKMYESFSKYAVNLKVAGVEAMGDSASNARALKTWLDSTGQCYWNLVLTPFIDKYFIDESWLLIFDNLDDVEVLRNFWPASGGGHIIVTSRDPFAASFRACCQIEVLGLNPEDSIKLFYDEVGQVKSDERNERIEALIQSWRGVPLAINQMSSYISRVGMDLNRFVKIYSKSAARLFGEENIYAEYPHSVATAFATQQLDTEAKAILQALCFFDPDQVPNELLQSGLDSGRGFNAIKCELK